MSSRRFEGYRDRIDGDGPSRDDRVYPNTDDAVEPHEAADPHTLTDSTASRWWHRFTRSNASAATTIAVAALAAAVIVVLSYYGSTFFVSVVTNPWFQGLVGAGVLFGAAFVMGDRRRLSMLTSVDELAVKHVASGRAIRWRGEFDAGRRGFLFTPYKGTRGWFGGWAPLTKGEVVGDTINPESPATILLPMPEFAHAVTEMGEIGVMKVQEFIPFPAAGQANVRAVLPDDGGEDTIQTARQELTKLLGDIEDYEEQLNAMETRLRNANERAGKPHDEVRAEGMEWLLLAHALARGGEQDLDRLLRDASPDVEDTIARVNEELIPDED